MVKKGGRQQGRKNLQVVYRQKGTGKTLTSKEVKDQNIKVNKSWEKGKRNEHGLFLPDTFIREYQNTVKRHNRAVEGKYQKSVYAQFINDYSKTKHGNVYTEKLSMSMHDITDLRRAKYRIDKLNDMQQNYEKNMEWKIFNAKQNYAEAIKTEFDDTELNRLLGDRIKEMSTEDFVKLFKEGIPSEAKIEYIYLDAEVSESVKQLNSRYNKMLNMWVKKGVITRKEKENLRGVKIHGA